MLYKFTFDNTDKKYFYFNSLNKKTIFIVEENSLLLGAWSNFYIKENCLFIKKLKNPIVTDDGTGLLQMETIRCCGLIITQLNSHMALVKVI